MRNFPRPDLVDAVTVKFSFAELQTVADRISADADELARQGAKLSTWGVNPTTNRVRVGIDQPTPAVIENLQRRYGAEILDIVDQPRPRSIACVSRQSCTPEMRGGLEIVNTDGFVCSSGFEATRGGVSVLLTAGHCFDLNTTVLHSGIVIGAVEQRRFNNFGDLDAEQIAQNDVPGFTLLPWKPSNWIYADDESPAGPNIKYAVTGVKAKFGEVNGEYLCRTGRTTGMLCGQVIGVNQTIIIGNEDGTETRLAGQNFTDICALPGDSGGPYFNVGIGYGMASAASFLQTEGGPACFGSTTGQNFSSYSPQARAQEVLGVQVRTSMP